MTEPLSDLDALEETLAMLSNSRFMSELLESLQQAEGGEFADVDDLR